MRIKMVIPAVDVNGNMWRKGHVYAVSEKTGKELLSNESAVLADPELLETLKGYGVAGFVFTEDADVEFIASAQLAGIAVQQVEPEPPPPPPAPKDKTPEDKTPEDKTPEDPPAPKKPAAKKPAAKKAPAKKAAAKKA